MGKRAGREQTPVPAPPPVPQRLVHYNGQARDIVFAARANGSHPAKEFLDGLSETDQVRFNNIFLWMAERGEIRSTEKFHHRVGTAKCTSGGKTLEYSIAEFKIHSGPGQRILAYLHGSQWVLTNGFAKGENLSVQTRKASQIICEDLAGQRSTRHS
jgi:hypothetical protein